ncbi:hypothetical protein DXX93_01575 [Thalassotalea euphylliae]|uniref:Uncharacterized protein n=1 Tax=Thalassotalea euphylliae TaxID=1655234 RepID=A0A3E0TMI0_9GAMM|nr:hypothetical protein DXX93_01575 [Thalassotalea euphylliae]
MGKTIWKFIAVLFLLIFTHDVYDFSKLFYLDLLDTPNWLNIGNLLAGAILLISLVSYAFNLRLVSAHACYFAILVNVLFLVATHYYEFSLGGYDKSEMILVVILNLFILLLVSSAIWQHAKELKLEDTTK